MKKFLMAGVAMSMGMAMSSAAMADIAIATAGPMTGQYASFGAQMKAGAEQAVADINAAGGINGEKLVLEVGDDACDPKQAVAVANQMVGKGVVFMASFRSRRLPPIRSSPTSVRDRAPTAFAVVTISRARSLVRSSPSSSATRTSPSSTTRRLTVRALPTRRRSTWKQPARSRRCSSPLLLARRITPRSFPS